MKKPPVDFGLKFEDWICHTLPWQLNLSKSKEVAVRTKFSPFADFVRPLAKKAPEEFEFFFSQLVSRFDKIAHWRTPKGTVVIPQIYKGKFERYPNGKLRHTIVERDK